MGPPGGDGPPRGRGRPLPRPGTPPEVPFSFGPDFSRFPWSFFRRGSRARRGDVRAAILVLLAEAPRNGYQLIQELEHRTRGGWRPSPGSIYPTLEQLEDEGLVRVEQVGSSRTFALTEEGKRYVEDHAEELGTEPWSALGGSEETDPRKEVLATFRQVGIAMGQVMHAGNAKQVAKAKKVLAKARRELYRVLADDDGEEP
ncbi:MAG: PadR family transcriptional regulator [Deltaproteobacteria bacterium]|nr:PadR family transcriptional regulator [Deltaproteobacteria bacterium]